MQLKDVISDGVCELIGKRIDKVERDLHLSDAQGRDSWEYWAGDGWYDALFYEKYDFDWEQARDYYIKVRDQARENQHVELCWTQRFSAATILDYGNFFHHNVLFKVRLIFEVQSYIKTREIQKESFLFFLFPSAK